MITPFFERTLGLLRGFPLPKTEKDVQCDEIQAKQDEIRRQRDIKIAAVKRIEARSEAKVEKLNAEIEALDEKDEELNEQWWSLRDNPNELSEVKA